MASLLVRVCCLLACATALADEGGGTVVWARRGRTRLHCTAVAARLSGGEGHRAPPPHLALVPDGGVGAAAPARYDVTWWRDGEALQHKGASIKTDKPGTYRCGVRTTSGIVLGTENVVPMPILEKRFASEPEDTASAAGQPVALRCRIHSSPAANVTWLRDQKPLPYDDRYYILSNGDLIITDVTEEDAGSYSCNASNTYVTNKTRVSRSASLTVTPGPALQEPALLSEDTSGDLQLKLGEELMLPCLVTGSPKPQVEWRLSKEGDEERSAPLTFPQFLRLPAVELQHAGVYTCTVVDHPHLTKSWRVSVLERARIVKPPESIHKPSAAVVRLDCQAEGTPKPSIVWYKNGEPLALDGRVKVQRGPSSEGSLPQLVIGGAQPSDAGVYQCFAQSAGTAAVSAWAVLGVAGGALPVPTGVRCSPLGLKSVRLEWRPVVVPRHNDTSERTAPPLIYYTVHYVQANCTSGTSACKELPKPSSAPHMDVELDAEAAPYQFYVRAYYGKDASKASRNVFCQGQGVPVKVTKQQDSVRVEWEETARRLPEVSRWLLQYRPRRSAPSTQNVTLESSIHRYLLPGVTSEDDYEVRLLATTSDEFLEQNLNLLPWTSTRDALTNSNVPFDTGSEEQKRASVVPSELAASGQWARGVHLSWRCDACENSTSAYSFILCYKPSDPLRTYREKCINRDYNEAVVGSLEPGTQYEFRVQALVQRRPGDSAAGGGSPFSDTLLVSTLHDESRQIKNVSYTYTERGLYIRWTLLDTAEDNNHTVYTVHYSQNLTRPLHQWMQYNVTGRTDIELSGLEPDLKTFVVVSSRSRGQEEHGPVMEVPPRYMASSLPPYALLGIIAGAVVCVICLLCCVALCVWRHRKHTRARAQRPATRAEDEGTEMTTRTGAHVNGERRGADEPLLNGSVHGATTQHIAKTTPNGRYKRPAYEGVFDFSRRDDADTTLDTILELDLSDRPQFDTSRREPHPSPPAPPVPPHSNRVASSNKFPDDNMNCEAARHFRRGDGADAAPTLQPNG